jgi:dolichyl-phosphate beta-glucosyltransferase
MPPSILKAGPSVTRVSNLKPTFVARVAGTISPSGSWSTTVTPAAGIAPGAAPAADVAASLATSLPATDHEFTVIIPAYNEQRRLPKTLAEIGRFLDASQLDYRVIVADDGSSDNTPELAGRHGPRFSTVRLAQNSGKGCAVRTAMLAATGQVIAFTDADLPFQLAALRQGYDWIRQSNCEIVFGSRHIGQSSQAAKRNVMRKIATRTFHSLVKVLVSTDVTDTQCGLKIFSRRAAVEIFSRATVNGFAFDTEVVVLARRLGLAHLSMSVTLVNEEASTVSLVRHSLPMLWDVIKMRARLRHSRTALQLPLGWGQFSPQRHRAAA